jgi:hypothetical protein
LCFHPDSLPDSSAGCAGVQSTIDIDIRTHLDLGSTGNTDEYVEPYKFSANETRAHKSRTRP